MLRATLLSRFSFLKRHVFLDRHRNSAGAFPNTSAPPCTMRKPCFTPNGHCCRGSYVKKVRPSPCPDCPMKGLRSPWSVFLNRSSSEIWSQMDALSWGPFRGLRGVQQHPWPLLTRSHWRFPSPSCDNQICLQTLPNVLGVQNGWEIKITFKNKHKQIKTKTPFLELL